MKKDKKNTPDIEYDAECLDEHLQQEEQAHTDYLD